MFQGCNFSFFTLSYHVLCCNCLLLSFPFQYRITKPAGKFSDCYTIISGAVLAYVLTTSAASSHRDMWLTIQSTSYGCSSVLYILASLVLKESYFSPIVSHPFSLLHFSFITVSLTRLLADRWRFSKFSVIFFSTFRTRRERDTIFCYGLRSIFLTYGHHLSRNQDNPKCHSCLWQ